ncbi:hypothetical protein, partial [Candidatus Ichthyocystis hellenicum]|uniref:hypothetical protein n=1 Tax=Candidatus Ichthyocystis hellenicum TaxID=1561003 RepID=UPI00158542F0
SFDQQVISLWVQERTPSPRVYHGTTLLGSYAGEYCPPTRVVETLRELAHGEGTTLGSPQSVLLSALRDLVRKAVGENSPPEEDIDLYVLPKKIRDVIRLLSRTSPEQLEATAGIAKKLLGILQKEKHSSAKKSERGVSYYLRTKSGVEMAKLELLAQTSVLRQLESCSNPRREQELLKMLEALSQSPVLIQLEKCLPSEAGQELLLEQLEKLSADMDMEKCELLNTSGEHLLGYDNYGSEHGSATVAGRLRTIKSRLMGAIRSNPAIALLLVIFVIVLSALSVTVILSGMNRLDP